MLCHLDIITVEHPLLLVEDGDLQNEYDIEVGDGRQLASCRYTMSSTC